MIIGNIYAVNRDPEIWSNDAEVFKPERFINSDDGTLKKDLIDSVAAFSTGKRVCLGESLARTQLFLFITSIFQQFKFEPDVKNPIIKVDYYPTIVLQPKPYLYQLKSRK